MSFDELWSHCINGGTTVQERPTAFIINFNLGYVSRSTPTSEQIWIQKGSFLKCLYAHGASSSDTSWASTNFWGVQPPFFVIPSFTFNLTFQAVLPRSFGQSFTKLSGLPHPKQFQFFFWYSLMALANQMIYPTYWSAPVTPPGVSTSSLEEDSASFSPSGLASISSPPSLHPTVTDQAVKTQLPFNFLQGNKFLCVWEQVMFDPPVVVVFRSTGSLASAHHSNFWAVRSSSE